MLRRRDRLETELRRAVALRATVRLKISIALLGEPAALVLVEATADRAVLLQSGSPVYNGSVATLRRRVGVVHELETSDDARSVERVLVSDRAASDSPTRSRSSSQRASSTPARGARLASTSRTRCRGWNPRSGRSGPTTRAGCGNSWKARPPIVAAPSSARTRPSRISSLASRTWPAGRRSRSWPATHLREPGRRT